MCQKKEHESRIEKPPTLPLREKQRDTSIFGQHRVEGKAPETNWFTGLFCKGFSSTRLNVRGDTFH